MKAKVLFVDDEINVLNALKRQFRKQYDVSVADSGRAALEILRNDGPFSVVISDMQMPEMNGVEFLQQAQKVSPDTVRLMLTGNADQKTAIDAVNQGNVFSFYTKPASAQIITLAIEKAIKQYELITAERDLLEGTLNGAVKLLMDMLSMVTPGVFGETMTVRDLACLIASKAGITDNWHIKLASMLSNIGYLTLPAETLSRIRDNEELNEQEMKMLERTPEVSRNLINNIPRLERVAEIVYYQNKDYNGNGFPAEERSQDDIPLESRILHIAQDYEGYRQLGHEPSDAIQQMALSRKIKYDPEILDILTQVITEDASLNHMNSPIESSTLALRPGMTLAENVENIDGKLICSAGHTINQSLLERLLNYDSICKLKEPIMVFVNPDDAEIASNEDSPEQRRAV